MVDRLKQWCSSLAAALTFYTILPIPLSWTAHFERVACFAPLVGVLIGGLLSGIDYLLRFSRASELLQSAIVVVLWLAITGGLHFDGAMDTADGLAVPDRQRRLEVMSDSVSGAFGVMAAGSLLLLKITALSDLATGREFALILAAGWGRWAQQVAIVRYPYLKPTGKGAFHKAALRSSWDLLPSLVLLLGMCGIAGTVLSITSGLCFAAVGMVLALVIPAFFNRAVGGHTGDTYGAVVEWTEALFLVGLAMLLP